MGEIGIPRREFLYDIRFWEARRIIRGYRKRNRLLHQLIAENVYATIHVMRDAKGKNVSDLFPQLFEDNGDLEEGPQISEEDYKELQELMQAETERMQARQKSSEE